jgi:hypothetical protein
MMMMMMMHLPAVVAVAGCYRNIMALNCSVICNRERDGQPALRLRSIMLSSVVVMQLPAVALLLLLLLLLLLSSPMTHIITSKVVPFFLFTHFQFSK